MSDLAPFVAAVLRDEVVDDLKQENENLRRKLRLCRAVTISGPQGTPVYAEGQFEEGNTAPNPNLWRVPLTKIQPCPLSELMNIEIRLGNNLARNFRDTGSKAGFIDDNANDEDRSWIEGSGGEINFCFGGHLWLAVQVGPSLSETKYHEIRDQLSSGHLDQGDLGGYLSEILAAEQPDLEAGFDDVQFVNHTVKGSLS
jgi:hypothetical protein